MGARLSGALVVCLALAAPARALAQAPTVLVMGHSPDGVAVGSLVSDVATDLRRRGFTVIESAEAAAKLPGVESTGLAGVESHITIGERHYLDLELGPAEAMLGAAREWLDAMPGPAAVGLLEKSLERLALVQLASGEKDAAEATLDRLHRLDPAHRPDASLVSPRFAPAFEDAAKRVRSATLKNVRVVTVPEGADVWIDGRPVGFAPLTAPLAEGTHRVEARLSGFQPVVQTASLSGSEVTVRLTPATSEADRVGVMREALASGVLPAPRERFVADIGPRVGASAALVLTVRRGSAASADLYRASQPAASLDRVDGAESAGAWTERKLRPAIAAVATPPPARPRAAKSAKASGWVWIAGGAAFAVAAGAAYASSAPSENTTVGDGEKTVRFGGGQ